MTPVKKAPAKKTPAKKTPAKKAPVKKTPVKKTPAKKTPAKKTPAKKAPVKKTPAKKTPAKKTPVKKAPVKKTPAKKAPVKKAPAKKTPAKKTPAKKAPAKKTPVKKAPAKKTYTLRQEFSSVGTSKGAEIRSEDVERLKSLQARFHLRFPRSNQDAFRECLETFIPECPEFWAAVERAKSSKEEYIERLLRPENLSKRAGALNRGIRLVYSAASWANPSVGPDEKSALARGLQWRATMAWTGCELICEGLFQRIHNCEADILFEWCRLLELEELEDPIPPPRGLVRSSTVRNLWSEEVEILDFLDVRGGKPRRVLSEWWLRHSPIRHHGDALQASRALRDVTSHGLLSAHRVEKFGLSTVGREGGIAILERLVDLMVKVAVKTLERMG